MTSAPNHRVRSQGAYRRYARVYDRVWRGAPHARFVDLCLEAAGPAGRARQVVVAACGTATAALEFARRGHRVVGFDLSPTMLAEAMAKRRASGLAVDLLVADLRAVPLADGCADLVVALNSDINYLLDHDEVVAALRHLGRVAGRGGIVIVEPLSDRFLHQGFEPGRHLAADDFRLDATYEVRGDLLVEHVRWAVGGVEEAETYLQRYLDDATLSELFRAAGLRVLERRPMYPAIPDEPARGRVLWVAAP